MWWELRLNLWFTEPRFASVNRIGFKTPFYPIRYGDEAVSYKIANFLKNKKAILFQASGQTLGLTLIESFKKKRVKPFG